MFFSFLLLIGTLSPSFFPFPFRFSCGKLAKNNVVSWRQNSFKACRSVYFSSEIGNNPESDTDIIVLFYYDFSIGIRQKEKGHLPLYARCG